MLVECIREFDNNPEVSFDSFRTSSEQLKTEIIRGWIQKINANLPGVNEQNHFSPFVDQLLPSEKKKSEVSDESEEEADEQEEICEEEGEKEEIVVS